MSAGKHAIWDTMENQTVAKRYAKWDKPTTSDKTGDRGDGKAIDGKNSSSSSSNDASSVATFSFAQQLQFAPSEGPGTGKTVEGTKKLNKKKKHKKGAKK